MLFTQNAGGHTTLSSTKCEVHTTLCSTTCSMASTVALFDVTHFAKENNTSNITKALHGIVERLTCNLLGGAGESNIHQ